MLSTDLRCALIEVCLSLPVRPKDDHKYTKHIKTMNDIHTSPKCIQKRYITYKHIKKNIDDDIFEIILFSFYITSHVDLLSAMWPAFLMV